MFIVVLPNVDGPPQDFQLPGTRTARARTRSATATAAAGATNSADWGRVQGGFLELCLVEGNHGELWVYMGLYGFIWVHMGFPAVFLKDFWIGDLTI